MSAIHEKRILVCDEDPAVTRRVSRHFENLGCAVVQANDPSQAAASLDSAQYDLVILDLFMAKMNLEVLSQSAQAGKSKLAMLAEEDDGDHARFGRDSGADYYLAKPFGESDLARLGAIL